MLGPGAAYEPNEILAIRRWAIAARLHREDASNCRKSTVEGRGEELRARFRGLRTCAASHLPNGGILWR